MNNDNRTALASSIMGMADARRYLEDEMLIASATKGVDFKTHPNHALVKRLNESIKDAARSVMADPKAGDDSEVMVHVGMVSLELTAVSHSQSRPVAERLVRVALGCE